jgi:voltage-gated potassium channel
VLPRRHLYLILVPPLFLLVGTIGYRLVEGPGWTFFDALYMTVITLTTVGYQEVHPLSPAGRAFTIVLALTGVFTLLYVASEVIRTVVSGELREDVGRQMMERTLADMRDHAIVCGLGRMGRRVCKEFEAQRLPYVVIEHDENLLEDFKARHGVYVHGDATSDEVLRRAGVERAKALLAVVASDAQNLYITLSARLLNEKLAIVARAEEEGAEVKFRRAGANHVVSPYVTGGFRLAQAVIRPTVVDFIELATRSDYLEMQIEEITLKPGSSLVGQSLGERRVHQELGVTIVAVKRTDGKLESNPSAGTVLEAGSTLIVLGHREQLDRMEEIAAGGGGK